MKKLKLHVVNAAEQPPTCPIALAQVIDSTDQKDTIDHQDIRSLTQLILRVKPEHVDESLQAKMAAIMQKVRAQTA